MNFHASERPSQTLQALLDNSSQAFAERDYARVLEPLVVPTSVYIFENMLVLKDHAQAEMFLRMYRENLALQGYARTVSRVETCQESAKTGYKADVLTRHFSEDGKVILEIPYRVFGFFGDYGTCYVNIIESLSPPKTELLQGIPVV